MGLQAWAFHNYSWQNGVPVDWYPGSEPAVSAICRVQSSSGDGPSQNRSAWPVRVHRVKVSAEGWHIHALELQVRLSIHAPRLWEEALLAVREIAIFDGRYP